MFDKFSIIVLLLIYLIEFQSNNNIFFPHIHTRISIGIDLFLDFT